MINILIPSPAALVGLTLLGISFGFLLSYAKIKLKVERDPRIERVLDALPGANCGACGLPGCAAYAAKVVEENYDINLCVVGGAETAAAIGEIMGIEGDFSAEPLIARVQCQGGISDTVQRFMYNGPRSCSAAQGIMGGFKLCEYGCLGLGDCVAACPFDAIHMGDQGLPVVDNATCVGCGKCVEACPRDIITLVPERFDVYVKCKNQEKGALMKKGCQVGCIGCKICEKACLEVQQRKHKDMDPADVPPAIRVENFLADIDYTLCINCFKCVLECPVPVINPIEKSRKFREAAKKKAEAEAAEKEPAGVSA